MKLVGFALLLSCCAVISAKKVVIVGAGASGLAAASKLLAEGYTDVVVLEALNRIGGRVKTNKKGRQVMELGAEWLMGEEGNILYDLAQSSNVKLLPLELDSDVYVTTTGDTITEDEVDGLWNKYIDILSRVRASESSVEAAFEAEIARLEGNKEVTRALFKYYFESITPVANWTNEIGVGFNSYSSIEGNSAMGVAAGMESLLRTMMTNLTGSLPIDWDTVVRHKSAVRNIQWDSAKPIVEYRNRITTEIETIEADYVVVTVPLGVLKEKYTTLFSPELPPRKVLAIQTLQFAVVNKIFLTFERVWWPDEANLHILWTPNAIKQLNERNAWIKNVYGFYTKEKLPRTLEAWVVEEEGALSENTRDYSALVDILKQAFGKQGWAITDPVNIVATSWYDDQFFRGSYSYRGAEAYRSGITNGDLREPLKNSAGQSTIFFAGEATHDKYYSTLHGAVESGFAAAEEILKAK